MTSPFVARLLRPVLSIAFGGALCVFAGAEEPDELAPAVDLRKSEAGSRCVMVFATVGEEFRFDFAREGACPTLECAPGIDAAGEKSELPAGLCFDSEQDALVGVPQRPGFHEYVVLRTERGITSEQVVLIDIQGHSFSSGGMDYAAYFAGGIR